MTSLSDEEVLREMAAVAMVDVLTRDRRVDRDRPGPREVIIRMTLLLDGLSEKEALAACLACAAHYGAKDGHTPEQLHAALVELWPSASSSDTTKT